MNLHDRNAIFGSKWQLQSVTDTVAYAFDLPLQLFDLRAAATFFETARKTSAEFAEHFPAKSAFDEYLRDATSSPEIGIPRTVLDKRIWRKLLDRETCQLWATQASYENPFLRVLREHWGWSWWETLWFLNHFGRQAHLASDSPTSFAMPGFPGRHFTIRSVVVRELNLVLVAFPTFADPFYSDGKPLPLDRAEFVGSFKQILRSVGLDLIYDQKLMERLAFTRSGATDSDVKGRLSAASAVIEALATARSTLEQSVTDSELRQLTLVSILSTWSAAARRKSILNPQKQTHLAFRENGSPAGLSVRVVEAGRKDAPQIDLFVSRSQPTEGAAGIKFLSEASERMKIELSQTLDRINTCRHAYFLENNLLVRCWLNETFGELVPVVESWGKLRIADHSHLSRRIARWAAKLFHAEICTVTRYDYNTTKLEVLGFYAADFENYALWETTVRGTLAAADIDTNKRRASVSYRCVDDNSAQYVFRGNLPDDERTNFTTPIGRQPILSAIAVPIEILGRPFGVLSIFGNRNLQFDERDADYLREFAGLLSTHYYYQWLLSRCQQLNAGGLRNEDTLKQRYLEICGFLCDVLLAESATVWIPRSGESDQFVCQAWTNRPDLGSVIPENLPSIDQQTVDDVIREGIDEESNWQWRSLNAEMPALEEKVGSVERLRDAKYLAWCRIVIPSPTGAGADAIITLFSRQTQRDNNQWRNVYKIVSKEIALYIRAIRSRADWTSAQRHSLAHGLRQSVRAISQTAKDLAKMVDAELLETQLEKSKFRSLTAQVDQLGKLLYGTIDQLTTEHGLTLEQIIANYDPLLRAMAALKTPSEKRTDLGEFINDFGRPLQRQEKRHLRFEYIGPRRGPLLLLDPQILQAVLVNLLSNALKYARSGTTVLVVVLEYEKHVNITIKNEGAPLLPSEELSIFLPGYRGSAAVDSGVEGEGIGLYHAKAVAEIHGLTIKYRQSHKRGDAKAFHEFEVSIPARLVAKRERQ